MLEVLITWSWLPFPGLSMDRGKIFFFFNKIYREFILIVLIQIQDYRGFAQPHHPFLSRFPGLKSRFSATLTLRLVRFIPQHTHNDLQKKTHTTNTTPTMPWPGALLQGLGPEHCVWKAPGIVPLRVEMSPTGYTFRCPYFTLVLILRACFFTLNFRFVVM